ncbi:MAG: TolC family protein [Chthoniobacterales bacterium]
MRRTWICLAVPALFGGCAIYHRSPLDRSVVEGALRPPSLGKLQIAANQIQHPLLAPVRFTPHAGLNPDQAAILAVLINPSLRAARNRRGVAAAELFRAGILPNPQITGSADFVTGGTIVPGLVTGYGVGASWDFQALIRLGANRAAARANVESVTLDIAWLEWQTAQGAKLAVYRVVADEEQLAHAREVDARLEKNLDVVQKATAAHELTEVELATASVASQDAHAIVLGLEKDLADQRLALKKAIGLSPDATVQLRAGISLPSHVSTPSYSSLTNNLEERRLDLLALKKGYESQEEKVRAAILAQFPRINVGFNRLSDTSNVHTIGPAVTIDLPVFDRAQGTIAFERATRQKLRDEYFDRIFFARSDVAMALADIHALEKQISAAEAALPVLQHLVDVYELAAQQGNVNAFDYYSAQNNSNQKTIQILKLKQQLIETRIALELAAGQYIPARPNEQNSK